MRQMPAKRMYARGLPQRLQRLCCCTLYLGSRFHFSILHFFAKFDLTLTLALSL